jgi:hypothetical protein
MTSQDAIPPTGGAADPDAVMASLRRIAARRRPTAPGRGGGPPPVAATPRPPRAAAPASGPPAGESREHHPRRRRLGEILLDEGLVTREQVETALRAQAEERPGVPIGQLLVEQGAITLRQLGLILDKHRLGSALVETNAITEEQLEVALREQRARGLGLGEVLIRLNYVTERQLRQALAKRLGIRFVDLDRVAVDRGLAQMIDRDYARRHHVVPIRRAADHVTVAMDDPADYAVIAALGVAAGCRIEVVTAPAAALRRAFTRVYGEGFDAPPVAGPPPPRERETPATETVRVLSALRAASERVRHDLDAGARLLQGIERPSPRSATPPAGSRRSPAPNGIPRRPRP